MALCMAGIVLGLILMHLKNNKKKQLFLVSLLFISILYFVLTIKVFMPLFIEKKNTYAHLKYTVLGDDLNEYLKTIFTKPRYVFISLLENHTLSKVGYGAKAETLFFFLISGGFAVFYRPQILIMILPVFLQKFLHDQFSKWGINAHYSIEFVPIIAFAFFYWLIHLKQSPVIKRSIAIFFILVTAFATYSSFEKRYSRYFDELSINIFNKKHYSREFDVRKAKKELSNYLPEDAWVTAESDLIPHIAFRNKIYTFRNIGDADYFVYIKNNKQRFPKKELFFKHMKKYIIKNPQWVKHYEGEIIIYKKTGK
jgi:uncharacterized membrane protein